MRLFRLLLTPLLLLALAFAPIIATAQRTIEFEPFEVPGEGTLSIPVAHAPGSGPVLDGGVAEVDRRTGGRLAAALAEAEFEGKEDQTLTLYGLSPYARIDLIGVGEGPSDDLDSNPGRAPGEKPIHLFSLPVQIAG